MTNEEKEKLAMDFALHIRGDDSSDVSDSVNLELMKQAYRAGFDVAEKIILEQASEGFEEWYKETCENPNHLMNKDFISFTWQAAKLSAQKENEALKGKFNHVDKMFQQRTRDYEWKDDQCKIAVEALRFYATDENWQSVNVGYGSRSQVKNHDLFDTSTDCTQRLVGGYCAMKALKQIGEMK